MSASSDIVTVFETCIYAPIQEVWDAISDFGGWIKWSGNFTSMTMTGEGIGAIRRFESKHSGRIYEEDIVDLNHEKYFMVYGTVSQTPPSPVVQSQLVTAQLEIIDKNKTRLRNTVVVKPQMNVTEEAVDTFRNIGLGGATNVEESQQLSLKQSQ